MDILIFAILSFIAIYDISYCKIPNKSIYIILAIGVLNIFFISPFDFTFFQNSLYGLILGFIICIGLFSVNLFGAGDAKLLASLGFIVGFQNIITLILVSLIFSGLLAVLRLMCHGEFAPMFSRWKTALLFGVYDKPEVNSIAAGAVPMGGSILLGYLYCYFYLF